MDGKTLRALVDAGAVKRVRIVADGASFHVIVETGGAPVMASTQRGAVRTWRTLDAVAGWVRGLGIGSIQLELSLWQPGQRQLPIR